MRDFRPWVVLSFVGVTLRVAGFHGTLNFERCLLSEINKDKSSRAGIPPPPLINIDLLTFGHRNVVD